VGGLLLVARRSILLIELRAPSGDTGEQLGHFEVVAPVAGIVAP